MKYLKLAVISVVVALSSSVAFAQSSKIFGLVVGVSDGDTIRVLNSEGQEVRVRLLGIDAPESSQPFGRVSKRALSDLIFRENVEVRFDKTDRFGRIVGKIIHNNRDINLIMVKNGLAWHYTRFIQEQPSADRVSYARGQQQAQAQKIGIWSQPNPQAPWDFRRNR